jgi:hypothetical protein
VFTGYNPQVQLQCPCHERGNTKVRTAYWSDAEYHYGNCERTLKITDDGTPAKWQQVQQYECIFKHVFKMKKSPRKLEQFCHVIIMVMTRISRRSQCVGLMISLPAVSQLSRRCGNLTL